MFSSDRKVNYLWTYALRSLLVVLAAGLFIRIFFLASFVMSGTSMAPNLLPGDFIVALKGTVVSRGDIIIYACSQGGQSSCAGRILGIPGDRVEIQQGVLSINGEPALYEELGADGFATEGWRNLKHLVHQGQIEVAPLIVPPQHYFVSDDNRGQKGSFNGLISDDLVQGKVWKTWLSLDWYEMGQVLQWPKVRWSRVLRSID